MIDRSGPVAGTLFTRRAFANPSAGPTCPAREKGQGAAPSADGPYFRYPTTATPEATRIGIARRGNGGGPATTRPSGS